jgi:hypothetical protein
VRITAAAPGYQNRFFHSLGRPSTGVLRHQLLRANPGPSQLLSDGNWFEDDEVRGAILPGDGRELAARHLACRRRQGQTWRGRRAEFGWAGRMPGATVQVCLPGRSAPVIRNKAPAQI